MISFNLPCNNETKTKIRNDKHFPKITKLSKINNRNNIKLQLHGNMENIKIFNNININCNNISFSNNNHYNYNNNAVSNNYTNKKLPPPTGK